MRKIISTGISLLIALVVVVAQPFDPDSMVGTEEFGPGSPSQPSPPQTTPSPTTSPVSQPSQGPPNLNLPPILPHKPSGYKVGKEQKYSGYTGFNVNTQTGQRTGYTYYSATGNSVARVSSNGYEVWDGSQWSTTTYQGMRDKILEHENQYIDSTVTDPAQREELRGRANENANDAAKSMENQALAEGYVSQCANPWRCMGNMMKAYDEYSGIGEATAMFFPDYNQWTKDVRRSISQTFCGFVSIQNCFESLICGAILDISSGNVISGNVLLGRNAAGQPIPAGHLSAERSLPIILKGMERELILDVIGSEIAVINGKIINISEVDLEELPATELRLYRIQYSITNSHADKDLKFNLEVKGQTTRNFFSNDKTLKPGQTATQTIEVYSATKYDDICLTFNPSLPAGTGSTLIVSPKMVSQLCKPIVEYSGGSTSVGNYAAQEKESQQSGTSQGGFI
jgi:hypothetical protein